jgi:hypothetical protein
LNNNYLTIVLLTTIYEEDVSLYELINYKSINMINYKSIRQEVRVRVKSLQGYFIFVYLDK